MENIIKIQNLSKSYGNLKAVDNISFEVKKGSLFAFLGINGAGKSTTINILCSILSKDSGKIFVNNCDLDFESSKIKPEIGIVFQNSVLDTLLSVKDNLSIRASYYGLKGKIWKDRLAKLTELLDLSKILNRPFGKLSGGQKRRVDIARGLINSPKILILDEPTTGLDPQTRIKVWEIINKLRKEENMTVFLTTHYMEEANQSDQVVIIDNGKIVANDTPFQLKNKYADDYLIIYSKSPKNLYNNLSDCGYKIEVNSDNCKIFVPSSAIAKELILKYAPIIDNFELIKGTMDDVFLTVTGKLLKGESL